MRYRNYNNRNRGFTLIELIIVIVILAIITGISLKGYSKYIGQAKTNTDMNNINTVLRAMTSALSEEGVYEELITLTPDDKYIVTISNTGADIQNYDSNSCYMKAINDYLDMTDGHKDAIRMSSLKTYYNGDCYYIVAIPSGNGSANVIISETP